MRRSICTRETYSPHRAAKAGRFRDDYWLHGAEYQAFRPDHSTVTLLARFRGWSTSVPLATAT